MREATSGDTPMGSRWRSTLTSDSEVLPDAFVDPIAELNAEPDGAEADFCIFGSINLA